MVKKFLESDIGREAKQEQNFLADEDRRAVLARAALRRLDYEFGIKAEALAAKSQNESEVRKARQQDILDNIRREASGEEPMSQAMAERILADKDGMMRTADFIMDSAPGSAELSYALLAKAAQSRQEDYTEFVRLAEEIKFSQEKELIPAKPDDLWPDAVLMGVKQREVRGRPLPDVELLAQAVEGDLSLLKAAALAVPEAEREKFLTYLPEEERARAARLFDREISRLLSITYLAKQDVDLRDTVRLRTQAGLEQALSGEASLAAGGETKILAETLSELGDEESMRLLLEWGRKILGGKKTEGKVEFRVSQAARIINELLKIDHSRGGDLAVKFLARAEVPDRLFAYFMKQLSQSGYLNEATEKYLADKDNWPFLKRLLAAYPNQYNAVMEVIGRIPDYQPKDKQEEIFSAIKDLGSLTPIIFDRYRAKNALGRKEFAASIRELKPKFFRNQPIKKILPREDRDILAEMVYLAYKPVGMSPKQTAELMDQLQDQSEDLDDYEFPQDGYDFTLRSQEIYRVKEGEKIDFNRLRELRRLVSRPLLNPAGQPFSAPEAVKEESNFYALLREIAKAKTSFKTEEVAELLGLLSQKEFVRDFVARYRNLSEDNIYNFLQELSEIIGVYFKDNFAAELTDYFSAGSLDTASIMEILGRQNRQETFLRQLGKGRAEEVGIDLTDLSEKNLAAALTVYLETKAIVPLRQEINRLIKKFQSESKEKGALKRGGLKAYVSKNVGSFFAKASAGICTAQDIPLFNRDDHFHINIVEGEENVRGNIQAYIIEDGPGRSLVLRGFNPNSDFLKNISVRDFCEKVLDIGRQFVKDNNLRKLYIADQDGVWHALSNRGEVAEYMKRYFKPQKQRNYRLQVSTNHSIGKIYEV